jgi:hypothetical protein
MTHLQGQEHNAVLLDACPVLCSNATSPLPVANITDTRVAAYYSSPLYAIQSVPKLSGLAGLVKASSLGKVLANKKLSSTIFAPSNDVSAVRLVASCTFMCVCVCLSQL